MFIYNNSNNFFKTQKCFAKLNKKQFVLIIMLFDFETTINNVKQLDIDNQSKTKILDLLNTEYTMKLISRCPSDIKYEIYKHTYISKFTKFFGIEFKDYILYHDIYSNLENYANEDYIDTCIDLFKNNSDTGSCIHIIIMYYIIRTKNRKLKLKERRAISNVLKNNRQKIPIKFYNKISELII